MLPAKWYWMALVAGAAALTCGFLAMRWGDDFWMWIAEHRWWFSG
jgi:hypothetical protein